MFTMLEVNIFSKGPKVMIYVHKLATGLQKKILVNILVSS